ncbi:hypothetical protein FQR65_LT05891 [Abscondita terminalis]|nr:hypothetical protein FQR65_LT05891 [Abscondita terminalis]
MGLDGVQIVELDTSIHCEKEMKLEKIRITASEKMAIKCEENKKADVKTTSMRVGNEDNENVLIVWGRENSEHMKKECMEMRKEIKEEQFWENRDSKLDGRSKEEKNTKK